MCVSSGFYVQFTHFFPSVLDYEARTFDLTFSRTISQVKISIPILNDNNVEGSEHFFGALQAQGTSVTVIASPDIATVVILEDPSDGKSERMHAALFFLCKTCVCFFKYVVNCFIVDCACNVLRYYRLVFLYLSQKNTKNSSIKNTILCKQGFFPNYNVV